MIGNHQLDSFETFICLGISLDREALAATIRMSESALGRGPVRTGPKGRTGENRLRANHSNAEIDRILLGRIA